ncbi:MAG: 16S rRNA (guanine(527)-N(7))-methyltransferase RsmG [Oscillospiraceae bacterium]
MNKAIFTEGMNDLNINISDKQMGQFSYYSRLLVEWNEKMNLTTIVDDDGIAIKHFIDSILPLKYIDIPNAVKVADVGTGAGFPGLPIKIMREDIHLTLIDSLNKRVNFLKEVTDKLELSCVDCVHGRAEELGRNAIYREAFDVVVSRAVANLTTLAEYCLPYVKVGGIFIALKAEDIENELASAVEIINNLGCTVLEVIKAPLPKSDIVRNLIVIKKLKSTPSKYPRSTKQIKASQE